VLFEMRSWQYSNNIKFDDTARVNTLYNAQNTHEVFTFANWKQRNTLSSKVLSQ